MTEQLIPPRGFVPSERELSSGSIDYEPPPPPPPAPPRERPSLRALLQIPAEQLNFRAITRGGPLAPAVLLFLLFTFNGWDDSAFGVLLPEIRREFGFDIGFVLVVSSLVLLVTDLLAPMTGFLMDRVNRVRMVGVGGLVSNLSSVALATASGVPGIATARSVAGLGQAAIQPAALPLVADWYPPERRARINSLLFTGFLGGLFIGPLVAGAIGSVWGWRAAVATLATLPILCSIPFFFFRDPPRGATDRAAMGAMVEGVQERPPSWREGWRAASSIVTLRRTWYATPFLTAGSTTINALIAVYYADEFGASPFQRGLIGTVTGLAAVLGLLFAGPIADRLLSYRPGRVLTLLAGIFALNAGSALMLALSPVLWLSIVIMLPIVAASGLVLPAQLTLTSLVVPARLRGFGIQTIAPWRVAGYLVVFAVGALGNATSVRGAMVGLVPIFLIGAVITASAAPGVERDIRAARAAAIADEEARRAREEGAAKLLVCRDVDVTYAGTRVLFHVDLDVAEGEMMALLGTNGAGKSTLLRAIAGLQPASNGAIFLDGHDVTHRPPGEIAREGVVYLPGGRAVFPSLTVAENLRAAAWLHRDDAGWVEAETERMLELFPELRDRLKHRAGLLSGGEQQMVAVAQSFLMRPRLLMIDELSLGLAPAVVERLLEVVRRVHEAGTTVVLVEQSVNIALSLAHRAVFMDKGEIRFDGPVRELLHRDDLVRSVFLGGAGAAKGAFIASGTGLRRPSRGAPPEEVLRVEDVHVRFGGRTVVDGASLELRTGEVLGIIGPNGAGKTTLFDAISGYAPVHAGNVAIAGVDATGLGPDARARLGLARSFQNARLFPSLTARENIEVALELRLGARSAVAAALWAPGVRRSEQRARRRADYLVDLLALDAYADKFVGELSTGTRRMVDLACVMAAEPKVLLLDEPSSGLSQAEVEALGPVVRRLAREAGCGVVVIEHDIPLVTALSDRMLALVLGRVLVEGDPTDVVTDQEVVRAYLGASQAAIGRSGALPPEVLAAAGLLDAPHSTPRPEDR